MEYVTDRNGVPLHKGSRCYWHDPAGEVPPYEEEYGVYEEPDLTDCDPGDVIIRLSACSGGWLEAFSSELEVKDMAEIIRKAEDLGWEVHFDSDSNGDSVDFSQYSNAGEDFSTGPISYVDPWDIAPGVQRCYEDFDVDEHVEIIKQAPGAPSLSVLIEDAQYINVMLASLADALNGNDNNSKHEVACCVSTKAQALKEAIEADIPTMALLGVDGDKMASVIDALSMLCAIGGREY